ncbi:NAD(P)/FAD-dependent oxidoreductase [Rhodococcus erythropolis]|uniref:Ferredoxin reductase n=1 Tax=Rhodococcus erythropolis (strain PR4 / NBRC 100887) TaxID=234621 RepID=C0ZQ25_RHOE4|nr:FAD-dependent oxidoreductase [Rhodococcus erythropolis]BAH31503.1 ferredoxin reductase [Rhodococcus erythropolis PR4]
MTSRLVVVGASLAGLKAVETARKIGFDGTITLIGAEDHLPYDRPPLSKAFLDADADQQADLAYRDLDGLKELDVELVLGSPATRLDVERQAITADGTCFEYDAAVLATGAQARTLPGTEGMAGVHTLRTLDDARAVRAALDAGARTVVIGAGFIGSEVASGARKRGLDVTVVEALPTPLIRAIGEQMGETCSALHTANGTDLRCGTSVEAIEGGVAVERVRLSDGSVLAADLVVVGVGAVPATAWLEGSGLELDNGIVCDNTLWTGVPGVYAAGDVCRWRNGLFDRSMRLEHWTSASEQGALAVRNALDPDAAKPYSTVPYFWSDWYDTRIQFVGVPDADEIDVVGDVAGGSVVALYRSGDRLVGALALNRRSDIMKYRALILKATPWATALDFAREREMKRQRPVR